MSGLLRVVGGGLRVGGWAGIQMAAAKQHKTKCQSEVSKKERV